jgi:cobalt-zinc-cadmium efflux system protein
MKDIESDSEIRSHQGHDHGHDHGHGIDPDADARYLGVALGLILAFMVGEVIVAFASHSLALLADAGHMLTDAGAIGASLYTVRLLRRPANAAMTFGWRRAEILSAAFNGLTLLAVGIWILAEAIDRLVHPSHVQGAAMLVVAAVGVVVNLSATLVMKRASSGRMDVAGAVAHLVTDVWAFAGTFVAGVVIVLTGFDRADPIASIIVVGIMAKTAWPLLRGTSRILLEATPENVDLDVVRGHILEVPEVVAVHDLHAWTVGSDLPAVSAHVVVDNATFVQGQAPGLLDRLQACLAGHFDVAHSTFQLELAGHADHEPSCHD